MGNLLKIAGFSFVGFSFAAYGPTILCMIPAALLGTWMGNVVLGKMDQTYFLIIFRVALVGLALKLIVFDGISQLLS
jgi:uncharacterized membrane protein YfcA